MVPETPPPPRPGIQVNVAAPPASRHARVSRKKKRWGGWLPALVVLGLVVVLAVLGLSVSRRDSTALAIVPMAPVDVIQGEMVRLKIPISADGYDSGQVAYSLGAAPAAASIDRITGVLTWPTGEDDTPGTYKIEIKVDSVSATPGSDQKTLTVRLREDTSGPRRARRSDDSGLSFDDAFNRRGAGDNPYEIEADLTPKGKIDELVFAKLEELEIEPANLCSDGVFLRRAYLDVIGTLPTANEAREFLGDENPDKRAALVDALLERPEYADYWAMNWCDVLRVKAEFPINLWPNAAQAYHHWLYTSLEENMPYDQFARELLTACGSNFRTPQVNFYRALQNKEPKAIAQAVALAFMGERAEKWPAERLEGMAVFFSQVGYKRTGEWKEEIVVFDPRKGETTTDGEPLVGTFPDGTTSELSRGKDPREVFADWLIDAENPWFARQIVNRVWYWLLGRGIVHEPDDIRPDNPPQNLELLNYLAEELVQNDYDLKHVIRLILNSNTYQLSSIPKGENPEASNNFACYGLRRLEAEVLLDAICQITGTTESYSSMIPEPFTWIPEKHRSIALPDGSITSAVLEMFGRPPRDSGMLSERNNRITAAQELHLLNSSHIRQKIQKGPKIAELFAYGDSLETVYLTILSRYPTDEERGEFAYFGGSRSSGENLVWALINCEEFLFRH